jgi:hypothetical protein
MNKRIGYNVFHWGPCIVQMKIPEETRKLFLREGKASSSNAASYLAGLLDKQVFYRDNRKFDSFFSETFNLYNHALSQWKKTKDTKPPMYYLEKLWINFQRPNNFNPPHSHGGRLSFVIYLEVPKELKEENQKYEGQSAGPGGITFLYGDSEDYCITNHSMFPEEGDMFIFPAWVKHWVYPFKSDCTRISVSGNVLDSVKLNQLKGKKDGTDK